MSKFANLKDYEPWFKEVQQLVVTGSMLQALDHEKYKPQLLASWKQGMTPKQCYEAFIMKKF